MGTTTTSAPTTRDRIIGDARNAPELLAQAQKFDPAIAAALTGKALIASKTIWGTLATMGISWTVTKYGLGWSDQTDAYVSGLLVMAATAALRDITMTPITGWFTKAPVSVATPSGVRVAAAILIALILPFSLGACAGQTAQQTTQTTIYTVQESLLGAQKLALTYLSQPPCGATVSVTCVDPATKAKIKTASATATAALDSAVAVNAATGSPALTAAAAAVAAMAAAVP